MDNVGEPAVNRVFSPPSLSIRTRAHNTTYPSFGVMPNFDLSAWCHEEQTGHRAGGYPAHLVNQHAGVCRAEIGQDDPFRVRQPIDLSQRFPELLPAKRSRV